MKIGFIGLGNMAGAMIGGLVKSGVAKEAIIGFDVLEQFMYFFGIALVLFVLEMLIGERRLKKHLFDA